MGSLRPGRRAAASVLKEEVSIKILLGSGEPVDIIMIGKDDLFHSLLMRIDNSYYSLGRSHRTEGADARSAFESR